MSRGMTMVWSGWQTHLPSENLLKLSLPLRQGVTGTSREEFIFDKSEKVGKGTLTYPAADLDPRALKGVRPEWHLLTPRFRA